MRVHSLFDDGSSSVRSLAFGGNASLETRSRSASATLANTLSWFDDDNKHRIKLASELHYRGDSREQPGNRLGSFSFNSLADVEAGQPAGFSRTLTTPRRSSGYLSGSLSLGDSYRRSADLQIQYGLRLDAGRPTVRPAYNPAVEAAFGRRNDHVPTPLALSPRLGFSWTVGRTREVEAFAGAARRPRAVVSGGIGVFSNDGRGAQVGQVLEQTGLPGGVQQIVCVGAATPVPRWADYLADPAAVPERCADGRRGRSSPTPRPTSRSSRATIGRSARCAPTWAGAAASWTAASSST